MGFALSSDRFLAARHPRESRGRRLVVLLALFALALLRAAPGHAETQAEKLVERPNYTAELVAESAAPRPGQPLTMAIHIVPHPGWHIYWLNPGEAGYAPGVEWTMPPGFQPGPVKHPVPIELVAAGIASNVHEGETTLLQDLAVPTGLPAGQVVRLKAAVDILVCSESVCVPDPVTLETSVAIGDGQTDAARSALFRQARAALPQPVAKSSAFLQDGAQLRIFVPGVRFSEGMRAHFFGETEGFVKAGAAQSIEPAEGGVLVTAPVGDAPQGAKLSGVLRLEQAGAPVLGYAFTASRSATLPEATGGGLFAALDAGFFLALGGAILGGLLLNLMPCVFPILSLKAMSLVRYGESDHEARVEALGYSTGVIGVILALGSALLILRSGGSAMGWAFQLQDPRVVGVLFLLVLAIATCSSCPRSASISTRGPAISVRWAPARWPRSSPRPAPARSWPERWARRWSCPHRPRWRSCSGLAWGWPCRFSCWGSSSRCADGFRAPEPGW